MRNKELFMLQNSQKILKNLQISQKSKNVDDIIIKNSRHANN